MKLRSIFASAWLLGCTGLEEPLDFESEQLASSTDLGFVIAPPLDEGNAPPRDLEPAPTLEAPPIPATTPARWEMWRVLEDVDTWQLYEVDLSTCDVDLPRFPTVAADGSVLALALVSAPVADEQLLTVRLLRPQDAKQVRAYTLLGPGESELSTEEQQRRVCHRAKALERALVAGGHTSMPVVGGWDNRIRDGLPETVDGWPRVISNGATREADATVADVVIAPMTSEEPKLMLRAKGPKSCVSTWSEFSKVWAAAGLRVFTRGPCGC